MRRVHPVWWLNLAIALPAIVMALHVAGFEAIATPHIPWWALAAAIAITERWPVNLKFQSTRFSFSLTEIPIVFALLFAPGGEAIAALALGTLAAMLGRRQPLIKLTFNTAQFLFTVIFA